MRASRPSVGFSLVVFAISLAAGGAITRTLFTTAARDRAPAPEALPTGNPSSLSAAQTRPAVDSWLAASADYATRADALRALLVALPADGFPYLLSGLLAKDHDDDRRLLDIALDVWIERHPADAALWAAQNKTQAARALRAWASIDPIAAAAWACGLANSAQIEQLGGIALSELAATDPDRALALLDSLAPETRAKLLPALLRTLGQNDPAGTLNRYGPELWNHGKGYQHLSPLIANWAKTDPRGAITWLLAQPRDNDSAVPHWLSNLAANDRENWRQFALVVAGIPELPNRSRTIAQMLSPRGGEQPAEIFAFIDTLPDAHLRTSVLLRLASTYSGNRPDQTLPFALALPESIERTEKLQWLLSAWADHDPSATLAWINTQEDPGVAAASATAHASVLGNIAKDEPETAITAWNEIANVETRKAALEPIARAWGKTDPAAALQWLRAQHEQLSPNTYRDYDPLIFAWSQRDPEAALRWAEQLSLSQAKALSDSHYPDPLRALAGNWDTRVDRAATADLYTKVQDPKLRASVLSTHLREWLQYDRKAATAWLESNDALSPEQAAALLQSAR